MMGTALRTLWTHHRRGMAPRQICLSSAPPFPRLRLTQPKASRARAHPHREDGNREEPPFGHESSQLHRGLGPPLHPSSPSAGPRASVATAPGPPCSGSDHCRGDGGTTSPPHPSAMPPSPAIPPHYPRLRTRGPVSTDPQPQCRTAPLAHCTGRALHQQHHGQKAWDCRAAAMGNTRCSATPRPCVTLPPSCHLWWRGPSELRGHGLAGRGRPGGSDAAMVSNWPDIRKTAHDPTTLNIPPPAIPPPPQTLLNRSRSCERHGAGHPGTVPNQLAGNSHLPV